MLLKSRIKYIQSLGHKKSRQEAGEFVIEGPKLLEEFLRAGSSQINAIYALESWVNAHKSLLKGVPDEIVQVISVEDLERMSSLQTPNLVLGLVRQPEELPPPEKIDRPVLVLDTIQDPGNLGTMIRTADWFGLSHVVCSHACADRFNPKVVQSTMGSILRVHVSYTDLDTWIRTLGDVPVFATALEGSSIFSVPPIEKGLILIGNESRGLDPVLASLATDHITIPRKGGAESLNAAVAAGIVLSVLCGR